MKKIFLILTHILPVMGMFAQTGVTISPDCLQNDQTIDLRPGAHAEGVSGKAAVLSSSGRDSCEFVQLWAGGPRWAAFNVGATITDYANLTIGEDSTSFSNNLDQVSYCNTANVGGLYAWNNPNINGRFYAWNYDSVSTGISDVATTLWGSNWKTPTRQQLDTLQNSSYGKTTWTWCDGSTTQYVAGCTLAGYKVSGVGEYARMCIFLPAAGFYQAPLGRIAFSGRYGDYWSTLRTDAEKAWELSFYSSGFFMYENGRCFCGYSVRAVLAEQPKPESELPSEPASGAFSISATVQIQFAPGNLQYQPSSDTWRFAGYQNEIIGTSNNIDPSYTGLMDLFGWGTGNNPLSLYTTASYYTTFTDWGIHPILNGNNFDAPNTWRTLTKEEWTYILCSRPNADILFGLGSINGVNGLILLPDNWTTPTGLTFRSGTSRGMQSQGSNYQDFDNNHFADNTYTSAQWIQMENAGAVFLPAAGLRFGASVDYVGKSGYYWSSTGSSGSDFSSHLLIQKDYVSPAFSNTKPMGFSVRLVRTL